MSAGKFTSTFYQTSEDNGDFILTCRVQPETLAAEINGTANAGHPGPANAPGSATISQGKRTAGVNMRSVTLQWTGAKPAGYEGDTVRIPVLRRATAAQWVPGATGTYLGQAVRVVGRTAETIR